MKIMDLKEKFARYMGPIPVDEPIIVRGSGATVEDVRGRRYLDLSGGPGVVNFGHCHPRITAAIREQAGQLTQSPGRYITPAAVELAEILAECTPGVLRRTFFCNSGAEAVESALKLAKKHAFVHGRGGGLIAFEHAFHGRTTHALAVTGQIKYKWGLDTYLTVPGILHVPYPYALRSPAGAKGCAEYTLDRVREALRLRAQGTVAAIICEPIQAVGGVIIPPDGFLAGLRRLCDEHGLLLIFDEIFVGLGRTGAMFACQHWGVTPDILILGKAIGGGLPLTAFITTDEIAACFAERKEHFSTFSANNPISCAAGVAGLRVIIEERLPERAAVVGARMLAALREAADGVPGVAEVRGKGLLIGIEFADADDALTPRADLAARVLAKTLERGLLVMVCGAFNSVVRLSPPLTISDEEVETAAGILREILQSALH
ncbi:MAG: aspartate aminotransferase family protein [Armatimonadetes bacterium]|nr:aspartate aminotransferase family protein [Armatimonadota bacterium]